MHTLGPGLISGLFDSCSISMSDASDQTRSDEDGDVNSTVVNSFLVKLEQNSELKVFVQRKSLRAKQRLRQS